jgi:plasmid stabilization system protein ParE
MQIIRHPKLADDIRDAALHYAEVSERVLSAFWKELDTVLASVKRNPRSHHYDSCGLRRANFRKFPYHLLYEVEGETIYLVVLRHDRRHPNFGMERQP